MVLAVLKEEMGVKAEKAPNADLGVTDDPGRSGEGEKIEAPEDALLHRSEFLLSRRLAQGCVGLCPWGGEEDAGLVGDAGVGVAGLTCDRSRPEGRRLGSVRLFHSPFFCVSVDTTAMTDEGGWDQN